MSDPNFPSTDPRAQGIAAGTSGGRFGFMQVAISERAAKDFSKGMNSIETAGKEGTFGAMSMVIDKMTEFLGSPFIKVWSDLMSLMQTFLDAGGAEAAAKWREELFNEDNIKQMEDMRDGWHAISNAITDAVLDFKTLTAVGGPLDIDLKPIAAKWYTEVDQFGKDLGEAVVQSIIDGIKDAAKEVDWEKIFTDIFEDMDLG